MHLIEVSRKLFRQTGSSRETEGEKKTRRGYEFKRDKHTTFTDTHTDTCFISLKAKAGLAPLNMLHSKIMNTKRMEAKTLQTAVNYDPELEG